MPDKAKSHAAEPLSLEYLVESYASLVKRIALHLTARMPAHVALDDLIQAGMIGLIEAAQKFDKSKGASFETYAGIRIRGSMLDEVRKGDWAPRSVHKNVRRITEAMRTIEQNLGRNATDSEIAYELSVSVSEYHHMLRDSLSVRLCSLNAIAGEDGDETIDRIANQAATPFENIQSENFKKSLVKAIGSLPEREQLILSLYYEEEMNLKEIGEVLGVSESRVSQLHSQATLRLRMNLVDWQKSEPPSSS